MHGNHVWPGRRASQDGSKLSSLQLRTIGDWAVQDSDLDHHDGLGQAELIRKGEVSASELLEATIARVEARNPQVNAVVHRLYDQARDAAGRPLGGGPFAGVPFLVKDLGALCRDAPCGNGSRLFDGFLAPEDDELVRRYREAGLIVFGRTNSSEFGLGVSTEPRAYGATRNPWNLGHTAGGSSGGAAAAVASGMVPLAHGSDGGGSIRIPASCCGLFGLKPTRARMPVPEGWAGLSTHHVLTRSVRDSAALLDATQGMAFGAPYSAPPVERPFLQEVGADPGKLRIGVALAAHPEVTWHPDCLAAVEDAAALLAELGHEVEEASPALDFEAMGQAMMTIVTSNTAIALDAGHPTQGRAVAPDDVEFFTWAFAERGRPLSAMDYARAVDTLRAVSWQLAEFFGRFDLMLSPTLGQPPVPLGRIDMEDRDIDATLEKIRAFIPVTPIFNQSGAPAASVPLSWNAAGLPIGVHFGAAFGNESLLFRIASQLEQARPWFDRRPAAQAES